MSELFSSAQYQAEALLICLVASIVWAGVLFLGARGIERSGSMTSAERLWTASLLFAVLPSLAAPMLASFGVSLRAVPEPVVFESVRAVSQAAAPVVELIDQKPAMLTTEQVISAGALLYVYGVYLTLFLWAVRQAGLYFAVARAECVTDERLLQRIEDWAERLDVRMPAIKRSRHVSSVCITGNFRQTVIIPHGIEMRVATDDLVLMCAHELAHVRRGDMRLFTATQLARVLFWFNPLIARIAAHAELAAEESADALVLQKGVDRRTYAACFVEGLKFAAFKMNVQPALAPSFTPPDRHGRRRRLTSILSPEPARKTPLTTRLMLSAAASSVALIAFGQAALAVDPDSAAARRSSLRELPLIGDITLGFGAKSPAPEGKDPPAHNGLDIKAPKGAKVFAPGDGVVVEATDLYNGSAAWGKVVVIDHGHGLITRYAHLDSYSVRKGQRVKTGDVIAKVGATGKASGPHLHFETLREGVAVDPETVIAAAPEAPDPVEPAPALAPTDWAPPVDAAIPAVPAKPALPAAKPSSVTKFSYRLAPAPEIAGAPGVRKFAPSDKFADFRIINPVFTAKPLFSLDEFVIADGRPNGDAVQLMAEDMEMRLLGAANGELPGSYNVTVRNGDKVYRFTSDEPMTPEKREELRNAIKEMRNAEAGKNEDWRREIEDVRRDAETTRRDSLQFHREAIEEIRREAEANRRDTLEYQLQALTDARNDIDIDADFAIEEALADIEDAERDLEDAELTRDEIIAARAELREQRRLFQRDSADHKRAIENARREIDSQIAQVERELKSIGDENSVE